MTHPIDLATLLPGARRIVDGNANKVWKAQLAVDGHARPIEAYIKRLGKRELLVECVAAQIGRSLHLPVPRPFIVKVDPIRLPEPDLKLERSELFFGSEAADYPPLERYIPFMRGRALLREWVWSINAACFDEWIANRDRHNGNILFDGENFILIDHDKAVPEDQDSRHPIQINAILSNILGVKVDEVSRRRVRKKRDEVLPECSSLIEKNFIDRMDVEEFFGEDEIRGVMDFLSGRLLVLSNLVEQQMGVRQRDMDEEQG